MPNIICLRTKEFLTPDYVNILFDAIKRNTTREDCRYICFTDDPDGLDDYIEVMPLPGGIDGWWNKVWLFSQKLSGQTFYFDLDTIITSNIDEYLSYTGKFAMLEDFYFPNELASALMSWDETNYDVWDEWVADGMPTPKEGDQRAIAKYRPWADVIQKMYAGIYSYKQNDCERWPPPDSKIICFHGKPRPHELRGGWVPLMWRKGGAREILVKNAFGNTPDEKKQANMESNCKLDLPWLIPRPEHGRTLVIVGGSPSLKKNLRSLRDKIERGYDIASVNGTLKYLNSIGIMPKYHCQFDARLANAQFLDNAPAEPLYLIGSMSDPECFERLAGKNVILWHGGFDLEKQKEILKPYDHKPIIIVGGGSTIGLRAITLGHHLGYRKFVLYGMDSSFSETEHHAYPQHLNDVDGHFTVWCEGKKFECAPWMHRQCDDFKRVYEDMVINKGCSIKAVGDGLLPVMCDYFNRQLLSKVV